MSDDYLKPPRYIKELARCLDMWPKIKARFCLAENDCFICTLEVGHKGPHKETHSSGGCLGWSNLEENK